MANKHRGECSIKFGPFEDLRLRFDLSALAELEDYLDKPVLSLFVVDDPNNEEELGMRLASPKLLVGLIYAGVQHSQSYKGLTVKKIKKVLNDNYNFSDIHQLVQEILPALMCAFGVDQNAEATDEDPLAETEVTEGKS